MNKIEKTSLKKKQLIYLKHTIACNNRSIGIRLEAQDEREKKSAGTAHTATCMKMNILIKTSQKRKQTNKQTNRQQPTKSNNSTTHNLYLV